MLYYLCAYFIMGTVTSQSTTTSDTSVMDVLYSLTADVSSYIDAPTVNESTVQFYLYTRTFPSTSILLNNVTIGLINVSKPTNYIIHGYVSNAFASHFIALKDSYLYKDDYNVIMVDWRGPANQLYPVSAENTRKLGMLIAQNILNIGQSLDLIHVIGHSLGAQAAGFTGKEIYKNTGQPISKIFGLDPAGPLFNDASSSQKLFKTDANMVVVIHSNAGVFGTTDVLGTVDFYPNGGTVQPGCNDVLDYINLENTLEENLFDLVICNHRRALLFFNESINSNRFISKSCSPCSFLATCCKTALMGEPCSPNSTGRFYLTTNAQYPYAKG